MKQKNLHFLFLTLFALGIMGCPPKPEEKPDPPAGSFVYGGAGTETGNGLLEMPDGSILIVGAARLEGHEDYDVQLTRVNPNGSEIATYNFRKPDNEESGYAITATSTGYAVAGFSRPSPSSPNKLLIMEFDQDLNLLRDKEIASSSFATRRNSIAGFFSLANGGYLVGMNLNGNPNILGISESLNLENQQSFANFANISKTSFLSPTPDGGYMIGVTSEDPGAYNSVPEIIKLDANGQEIWRTQVDSIDFGLDYYSMEVLGTMARSNGNLLMDLWAGYNSQLLLEVDSMGTFVDTTTLPLEPQYPFMRQHPDGSVALAGYRNFTYGNTPIGVNFELAGLDTANNFFFTEEFGGAQEEVMNDMIVLSDGRYAMVGSTLSFGSGISDIYLVLFNR